MSNISFFNITPLSLIIEANPNPNKSAKKILTIPSSNLDQVIEFSPTQFDELRCKFCDRFDRS